MRNASERNVERFRGTFDFMPKNKANKSARVDDKIWKQSKGHT